MGKKRVERRYSILLVLLVVAVLAVFLIRGDFLRVEPAIRSGAVHTTSPHGKGSSPRTVLITGGAGFIGFHTALRLAKERETEVVVIDNFNSYYSVQLKKNRASKLLQNGVVVHEVDLCNAHFIQHLFTKHNFTAVVHMAAQAGITQSLVDPLSYVQANIECLTTLLDVMKSHWHTHLVYASSSSVYGQSSSVPFSPLSPPSPPANLYAALKLAGEQLVSAYCMDHGVKAVGLRFFTVYGPWGRPDMAVYKFAKKILAGDTIVLHEHSKLSVQRDFTYIDDVVESVVLALNHPPSSCSEVYNVGRGQPVSLKLLLQLLEKELGKTAKLQLLPLPSSELPVTHADLSLTQTMLGYHPVVELQTGVKRFVKWLVEYEQKTQQEDEQLQQMLQASKSLQLSVEEKHLQSINHVYERRIARLREKYNSFAKRKGIQLPSLEKRTFTYHPGMDSPGGTVMKAVGPPSPHKIPLLEAKCRSTEQCLAFNSFGEIKTQILPASAWVNVSQDNGLFVADVDVCTGDLHDCGSTADCHKTGPSQHICVCKKGYIQIGRRCLEVYSEGRHSEAEYVERLADQLDGLDWKELTSTARLVFFQGMDSPGDDYLFVPDAAGDISRLTKACISTHRCIAFNTNGLLKHSVQPTHRWSYWTTDSYKGLYILDVDYCSLAMEQCPSHSSCVHHGPANYSCICDSPRVLSSGGDECILPPPPSPSIHVVVSVDREHYPGLLVVIHSLLRNIRSPEELHVHVVVVGEPVTVVQQLLDCHGLSEKVEVEAVSFQPSGLQGLVHVVSGTEEVGNLASPANFARFFFHELFASLSHILYLDADVLVQTDITPLWEELINSNKLLVAAQRSSPTYKHFFHPAVDQLYYQRYGTHLALDSPTFNAGVYGVNLAQWRKEKVHEEVLFWMQQHRQKSLWKLGTQPILLLVTHGKWAAVDSRWNVEGLGWRRNLSAQLLSQAFILHWNGRRKPWLSDGLYRSYWQQQLPEACSGHGKCVWRANSFICQCHGGYSGHKCHENSSE